MKQLLLVATIFALLSSCTNAPKGEDGKVKEAEVAKSSVWNTQKLMGKVQSIEESEYEVDSTGAIGEMDSCCMEVRHFNSEGFVVKYLEKDLNGTIGLERKIQYTENNRFLSSIDRRNGEAAGGRTALYDENDELTSALDEDAEGNTTFYYTEMILNEYNQASEGKMYTGDSVFMGVWGRKYIDGMPAGRSWSDSTGKQIYDYTGELNENGFLGRMTINELEDDGTETSDVMTFTYDSFDEMGNWTQRTELDENGVAVEVKKRSYTYFE